MMLIVVLILVECWFNSGYRIPMVNIMFGGFLSWLYVNNRCLITTIYLLYMVNSGYRIP